MSLSSLHSAYTEPQAHPYFIPTPCGILQCHHLVIDYEVPELWLAVPEPTHWDFTFKRLALHLVPPRPDCEYRASVVCNGAALTDAVLLPAQVCRLMASARSPPPETAAASVALFPPMIIKWVSAAAAADEHLLCGGRVRSTESDSLPTCSCWRTWPRTQADKHALRACGAWMCACVQTLKCVDNRLGWSEY